jgi:hypothetical protein
VPQEVRDELEFIPVSKMDEVLLATLEEPEKLDLRPADPGGETPKSKKGKPRDRITGTPSSAP